MRRFVPLCALVLAALAVAQARQQHQVVRDLTAHTTHVFTYGESELYAPAFDSSTQGFREMYVMRSGWYNVPPLPKQGDGSPPPPPDRPVSGNPSGEASPNPNDRNRTPERERPLIPPGATSRKSNETVVPLWMHFETRRAAEEGRPDKACQNPIVRMQWKTQDNSGWYHPLQDHRSTYPSGGTGIPGGVELRYFKSTYNDANIVIANMGTTSTDVRIWVLCSSQLFEAVDDKDVKPGGM